MMHRMNSIRVQRLRGHLRPATTETPLTRFASALVWCSAMVAGALSCVETKPITGPDGTSHLLIKCPGGQEKCLREAAVRCPGGYRIITHGVALSETKPWVSTETELLVKCRSSGGEDGTGAPTSEFVRRPLPQGALGYRFRINQRAAEMRCEAQGLEAEAHSSEVRCSGIAKALGLKGFVVLKFCEGDLCQIDAFMPIELERAIVGLADMRGKLALQYGAPTRSELHSPPACQGGNLPRCIAGGHAVFRHEWSWEKGPEIVLSLSENQGGLALRITYESAEATSTDLTSVDGL